MTEVARAVVLPDLNPPSRERILTLLLFWESLDVACFSMPESSERWLLDLMEEGVVKLLVTREQQTQWTEDSEDELQRVLDDLVASMNGIDEVAAYVGDTVTDSFIDGVRSVMALADKRGLASVAAANFSAAAATLPPEASTAPRAEAALIHAAATGVSVLPETSIEDILTFRQKNASMMGRFRASITDLAHAVRSDASPEAILEQADAVIRNRVEPALADLETVLKRGRIRFVWEMMFGASSVVLAPMAPAVAAAGGGRVAARTIDYAFDRHKLMREHPFGLLHVLRNEFGSEQANRHVAITDPIAELREMMMRAIYAAVEEVPTSESGEQQ